MMSKICCLSQINGHGIRQCSKPSATLIPMIRVYPVLVLLCPVSVWSVLHRVLVTRVSALMSRPHSLPPCEIFSILGIPIPKRSKRYMKITRRWNQQTEYNITPYHTCIYACSMSNYSPPEKGRSLKHLKKLLCFEWSPPWHFKTACWHHFCLKLLSRDFCPTNYPNHLFHLAGHCACQSVKQDINMSVGHVK